MRRFVSFGPEPRQRKKECNGKGEILKRIRLPIGGKDVKLVLCRRREVGENRMPLANIISLIFFSTFVMYFFFGMYILSLNSKSIVHRVFFCICVTLCLWAFSFSIANSAPNYEMSLFWRRVSVLGWGSFYSILLHFILILTEKHSLLQKKWLYVLIYSPAAVIIFAFSLYTETAVEQYSLINTYAGWVNVTVNTMWGWLFNVYYAGFTTLGIGLIWQWGRSSRERVKKKQAYMMVASYATALLTGTLTEIVIKLFFSFKVPQIAPVIILIPISVMLYCIKRYGLMAPEVRNQVAGEGQILSEASRSKLYLYLTRAYILGAFMSFMTQYLINMKPLKSVLLLSIVLLLNGLILQLIQSLRIRMDHRDMISNIIVSASIPFLILVLSENSSSTVWIIPILFVMVSVAFSKRRLLFLIGFTTLFTLIWVWIKAPVLTMTIDSSDHIFRIGIFGIFLWIAFYINHIYLQRLSENEEQVKFQKLLSQISTGFVTANEGNVDEKISGMLKQCGKYFQADRICLFLFSRDQIAMTCTHEWCDGDIGCDIGCDVTTAGLPWWMDRIRHHGSIHIPEVAALPPEAGLEREFLQARRIQSLIAMPICSKDKVMGFLRFDAVRTAKTWRGDHQEMLKVMANLLADALGKVEAEKEINYMAYYDTLTGLPNRTLLKNRLEQAINLAIRSEKLVGVVFVDIDSFKSVNDTLGHDGGNAFLVQMAKRLSGYVRKYDTVARFGGDEFIVMIPQASQLKDIQKAADKIMDAFHQPLTLKNQEFFINASAGIAVFPIDGEEPEDLIRNADLAMYTSKEKGKNRYTFYSPNMEKDVLINMELTNSLYRALERNELVLHYQPQVSCRTREIMGVEALIRWQHPQKGIISPSVFIPIAEKTGLINPIGQWVLETACRRNKIWQDQGLPPTRMSVNLSVVQLRNTKLVGIVENILQENEMDPALLELEITESIGDNEQEHVINTLNELKALGVTISIDDFGTKYSSLSRLKTLPVDRIKIDMHFVHGISNGSKEEGIIKVILQLARTLGLKVTAEGVETGQQMTFLRESLCDEIQGYYFYKPMPADEVESILRNVQSRSIM